ncbi:MAG: MFS transporter [Alphaproteobacteria bacterium]|nr:MFS transporter [Alphaproteobacteria bacterium]
MSRAIWIVILCAGTILGVSVGIRQSFGLFLTPVSMEVGGGRELFALAMGLMNLVWGAAAPFAGAISDRYGTGRVAATGGLLYACGLVALTASGDGDQLILGGLLIGLGLGGTGFTVVLGAVGRAAPPERRSAALGVASVGGSIGQFAALPYAQALIDGFGWSLALLLLAVTALLMVLLARGTVGQAAARAEQTDQTLREAFEEARRHGGFCLLTAGFFVCGFHLAFVAVHLPAYLGDQGMPGWLGATALAVIGLCNIIGTYVCGVLGGRYPKKTVLSLLYLARAGIFVGFLVVPVSEASILALSAALGFLWLGTVPLTSGLVAHIFGPAWMSMLFGIVFLSHQVGGFLGAWLAGWFYDLSGSYEIMWWLSVALGLASAALHWPIAERPVARLRAAAVIGSA